MPQSQPESPSESPIEARITVRIPKEYQSAPVISELVSRYGIKVTIYAAQLAGTGQEDGWFKLGLLGHDFQIRNALDYLQDRQIEYWHVEQADSEDW
jgi:ABC-type methionine transport system ATPase subunit